MHADQPESPETPQPSPWRQRLAFLSRRRSFAWWQVIVVVLVVLTVGTAAGRGNAVEKTKYDDAVKARTAADKRADDAEDEAASKVHDVEAEAKRDVEEASKKADDAVALATRKLEGGLADRRAALDGRDAELSRRAAELDAKAAALAEQQRALDAATAGLKAAQFEDGYFEVGRDIQPGKYHTDGGSGCYWQKNRDDSGNLSSIIDNDNASGPITLTITAPVKWFKSQNCGTWTKVG